MLDPGGVAPPGHPSPPRAMQPLDTRPHAGTRRTADRERHAPVGAAADPPNRDAGAHNAHSAPHALERSSQELCMELCSRMPVERICLLGGAQQHVPDVWLGGTNGVPRAGGVHRAATRPPMAEGGRLSAGARGGQGVGAELYNSWAAQIDSAQACDTCPARVFLCTMESAALSCYPRTAATLPCKNSRCAQ